MASEEIPKAHSFKPDVTINSTPDGEGSLRSKGAVAIAERDEVLLRAFVEEEFRETFVEILEAGPEARLVTCIEVLSPSNKRPNTSGWEQYLRKRQALLQGHATNLVEIDLLRGGQRMPMLDPWPGSPYALLIARASHVPLCRVLRPHFRTRLPTIPVPLLKPDPDISLDLQPMIDAAYARSKYYRNIDSMRPLLPPLNAEDAAWLDQQLQARETSA